MPVTPDEFRRTAAGRFPLVHRLITFAELRRWYAEMREALKTSNRQRGGYKGWMTQWKKKVATLESENLALQKEKEDLAENLRDVKIKYQGFAPLLSKLQRFEDAVNELRRLKLVVDEQVIDAGYWPRNTTEDLHRGVDNFLEDVDDLMDGVDPDIPVSLDLEVP